MSDRLRGITLLMPDAGAEDRSFFMRFLGLLLPIADSRAGLGAIVFSPPYPEDALPVTSVQLGVVTFPWLMFDASILLDMHVGRLRLVGRAGYEEQQAIRGRPGAGFEDAPRAGEGAVPSGPTTLPEGLRLTPLDDLTLRLFGHLVRVDHLGVNLPTRLVSREEWEGLLRAIAGVANLYRYPEGQDWPFILPSSAAEFAGDISEFGGARGPKFEFVYDQYTDVPLVQLSIETDLSREELEELLPEPYGFAIPDLADIFRSAFVELPWPDLLLRLDLVYKSAGPPDEWETGEWLVREGGRIR